MTGYLQRSHTLTGKYVDREEQFSRWLSCLAAGPNTGGAVRSIGELGRGDVGEEGHVLGINTTNRSRIRPKRMSYNRRLALLTPSVWPQITDSAKLVVPQ